MERHCENHCKPLSALQAIALAEKALMAGRRECAIYYVNVAYAIFDANTAGCSVPVDQVTGQVSIKNVLQ